ncbi:MAG: selenocysteine-specific translation elongation factor [Desulfobacula sp.]|uniref:selenocysteine-specific translation elongation factor n=1 Tax=Desulfobacula sp. TaxID=2593537 RepID=UPI001DF65244|nr:selenocysteine-specific translation elongation factor [Desulfobacula sp.]MBT3484473.1 selenocysteine-specific translation elongation factor [Desulfobacula sp.]MBT3803111.1 selenocysteine-specific translation elongation factor [Desulfobacula sp.]MBT4024681.1 selenocysteine-specific translation elongation factor [Desulfobacula sp.]MBT4197159.1 selenocysteine-specific translation elongation factor [Desulfobacula sp.]
MEKNIILGTAGHIDHGKTSLVKALTGIETDRLKEEKERGITIELGFALLDLPNGQHIGIVDMPGHEKFVKNMVAGSSGIDVVVMVIAADEGVMPQTREHMEICNLMGIRHGMVALTKIDMVDQDLLELALDDINDFVQGTFLEDKPVIPVSSVTNEGLDQFVKTLETICSKLPERKFSSIFRLPVDRVFSMKGFGTVITGTLTSGSINVGNEIMVYPRQIVSKVRGIQVHGSGVEKAGPGTRTAINFQGLDKESVNRGDILSTPDTLIESYMVDAHFLYLKSNAKPAKNRTRIRFHSGTSEILGYLILLDREELLPGDEACVQFRLESPVCCIKDDRYVVRSYSPIKTIGGGDILNPASQKHKLFDKTVIQGLENLILNDNEQIILFFLSLKGYRGLSFSQLRVMTNIPDKKLTADLQKMLAMQMVIQTDKENQKFVNGTVFDDFKEKLVQKLADYHAKNPLKEGMPTQELKSKFQYIDDAKFFNILFTKLSRENLIILDKNIVKLSGHKVALQVDQHEIKEKIKKIYQASGLTPPFFRTICQDLDLDKNNAIAVLHMLIDEKSIIKTKDDLYFDAKKIDGLQQKLTAFLKENESITTPDFKGMTGGVSRKFVIPLIEYFDSINLTIRVGDTRQLRRKT